MIEYILFLFIIVLLYLLKSYRAIHKAIDTNNDNKVSEREIYDALQVLEKAKKQDELRNKLEALNTYF